MHNCHNWGLEEAFSSVEAKDPWERDPWASPQNTSGAECHSGECPFQRDPHYGCNARTYSSVVGRKLPVWASHALNTSFLIALCPPLVLLLLFVWWDRSHCRGNMHCLGSAASASLCQTPGMLHQSQPLPSQGRKPSCPFLAGLASPVQ